MNTRAGFTLIEFLIVLAIVGMVLASVGLVSRTWRQRAVVNTAAQQLARDIDKQRTETRRHNTAQTLTATTGSTSYQMGSETVDLPEGTTFTQGASVMYLPPYGTTGAPVQTFKVAWEADSSIDKTVRVVGVIGKVVVKNE